MFSIDNYLQMSFRPEGEISMEMQEFGDPSPYLPGQCRLLDGTGLGMTNCDGLKGRRTNVVDKQLRPIVISTGWRNLNGYGGVQRSLALSARSV